MADELNMHFSSVFAREDNSSLPVPEKSSMERKVGAVSCNTRRSS